MHRRANGSRIDFFTTCSDWLGSPVNAEPHKCSELVWSPLHQLPNDVISYVREAISNYRRGVWFASRGWVR
jgi:hypothetical protein